LDGLLSQNDLVQESLLFLDLLAHDGQVFAAEGQQHVQLKLNEVSVRFLRSFALINQFVLLLDFRLDLVLDLDVDYGRVKPLPV